MNSENIIGRKILKELPKEKCDFVTVKEKGPSLVDFFPISDRISIPETTSFKKNCSAI